MLISCVIVLEHPNEGISDAIDSYLGYKYCVPFFSVSGISRSQIQLLVLSPKADFVPYFGEKLSCRTLIMHGSSSLSLTDSISAESIVSYGMSPRDCVTLSSISRRKAVLSIQRELPMLSGAFLDRQELPIILRKHIEPASALAALSALLLLGFTPESLS